MVVVLAPPGLLSAAKLGSGLAQAIPLGAVTPAGCAASTAAYSASSQLVDECCAFRSSAGVSGSGRGALVVIARGGTHAPPRSGTKAAASRWLEYVVTKPKLRKRRRGGRGHDESDGDSGDDGSGFGGSGGNWGNGGHGDWSSYSGGDAFGQWAQYELGWLWPLIVAASVLHSLGYIMTSTDDMRRSRIRSCSMASR
ncbi:hypothetical protein CHLRE_16g665500v5 [Chlamydomonas reinhardtii]|uniref:Uncharacterized protein n=1 Tax=Chlamydomonas reinhardtii TaxID=3055 RepID=A8JF82_CHLRE|nr:uncharacterized protein CHLRE_16g665500v5 [Chlamydomonas reinhardtii]PNW71702.1 hypothetical protein CHLRE_16g665500v5 [Chlamydomonas reinhardtii]|eukprot:XP_001701442.1 predicted protein [Chlamydomonas reinhardtii]